MKRQIWLLIFISGLIAAGSSCKINVLKGEGNKITSTPAVSSFNAIDIEVPFKVDIKVQDGAQANIQISGYENVLKHVKTTVENNTLRIYCDLGELWTVDYDDFTADITMPALTALTLSGAPEADIHGNITGNNFKLDISGAGKVGIDNINVDNFTSQISGAANIEVNGGAVKHVSYDISGAGKIEAFPLQSDETVISVSGAGKGEVTALKTLSANISGAGTIKYKGHPSIDQSISGAGSIKDVN